MAFINRRDQRHDTATALIRRYLPRLLITSSQVQGEAWTFLNRRARHAIALAMLDLLASSPRVRVAAVPEDAEREAQSWLRRHDERVYSFVDATSFMMMRRLGLTQVLSFGADFDAAGFSTIR